MNAPIYIESLWLKYLWIQSLNILPLALIVLSFSLIFAKKVPQITFGLWIILLLRLVIPVEYGFTSIPLAQTLVPHFEPEMLHFHQDSNLLQSQELANGSIEQSWRKLIPIIFPLILLGTIMRLGNLYYRRRKFESILLNPITDGPSFDKLTSWMIRLNIRRKISLFQSEHPFAPHTSGILNPRIILPQNSPKTSRHLDSILVHELGHILRWDDLFILISQSIMALFFFHPIVWLAQHFLNESREMAVDQMVVSGRYVSVTEYGSALIDVAVKPYSHNFSAPFSAPKTRIKKRILAIKGKQIMQTRTAKLILILSLPIFGISWISPSHPGVATGGMDIQFISPLEDIRVTSPFGERMHPIKKKVLNHGGIDLAGKRGTPVKATADGIVSSSKFEKGWGNTIRLEHDGDYSSVYAQLDKILVQANQRIEQGDVIGEVGSSGNSTGPHLHFELRFKNARMNPAEYIDF